MICLMVLWKNKLHHKTFQAYFKQWGIIDESNDKMTHETFNGVHLKTLLDELVGKKVLKLKNPPPLKKRAKPPLFSARDPKKKPKVGDAYKHYVKGDDFNYRDH